ncbi:MAG: DUF2974 domain-containing protein [Lachnospiraceae bacterium]|nr:DUF2974 domain-containing protein [Lachnospiraceae bacterium]
MAYTVRDMKIASRIAYYNIDQDILAAHNYQLTMREIFDLNPQILEELQYDLSHASDATDQARAQAALEDYNLIMQEGSQYGNWKIRKIHDTNSENGFYGCLIEASDSRAIIGFRGSESNNEQDYLTDWGMADAGLIDSVETAEQHEAKLFMEEISKTTQYDDYATTGHSLGGNLAVHAAITAPEELQKKIDQAVSMDGPGFSAEYLSHHKDEIHRFHGEMTHLQWSTVGNLLKQPDGTVNITARVDTTTESDMKFSFFRHDLGFVELDEQGNAIPGEIDSVAQMSGKLAEIIESGIGRGNILSNVIFYLKAANEASILIKDMGNWFHKTISDIENYFRQQNTRACFSLSVQKAASSIAEYGTMIKTMQADTQKIEEMRKDSSYLKVGSLPFQLTLLYLEGKIGDTIQRTVKMKAAMGQLLNVYQTSENKIIGMAR